MEQGKSTFMATMVYGGDDFSLLWLVLQDWLREIDLHTRKALVHETQK